MTDTTQIGKTSTLLLFCFCAKTLQNVYLRLYFFIVAQTAQVAWSIWTALAGQFRLSGQQWWNSLIYSLSSIWLGSCDVTSSSHSLTPSNFHTSFIWRRITQECTVHTKHKQSFCMWWKGSIAHHCLTLSAPSNSGPFLIMTIIRPGNRSEVLKRLSSVLLLFTKIQLQFYVSTPQRTNSNTRKTTQTT